ncbi:MAG: 3-phosphoglycerate dehydrogenase, partial [Oscillospiraceae bacterium]|nr:3-phosphoglycerate dehydrogenase [Oscillospiraceae bacterium]
MFTVKTLNKIAAIGTDRLDRQYFALDDASEKPDAIIVRSAKMADYPFNKELKCIARAGAGYNNIPVDVCAEKGIVVFNTPGANSNGVKELVICALLLASRDVVGGIEWVKSVPEGEDVAALVEKEKSRFVGPEIMGKTLGVVGLGAVGAKVALAAHAMGMDIVGYDPFLSPVVADMLKGSARFVDTVEEVYAASDYVTLHLPMNDQTKGSVNAAAIAKMKDGVRIINIARGELVDDDDMAAAIASGKVARYVTDFPNGKTARMAGTVAIPHLGASTPESEDNCAIMAADQISEFLLRGNIVNSVNVPNVSLERSGPVRATVIRRAGDAAPLLAAAGKVLASADR